MAALARYGLADAARRSYDLLSGGQKARLEALVLELEGHNLPLLDEPTDNLDIESSEALEKALAGFDGTVVAVAHDRAFRRTMNRHLMLVYDGTILPLPSYDMRWRPWPIRLCGRGETREGPRAPAEGRGRGGGGEGGGRGGGGGGRSTRSPGRLGSRGGRIPPSAFIG